MQDIFNIIGDENITTPNNVYKYSELIINANISEFKVDWVKYLHEFYMNNLDIDDIKFKTNLINYINKFFLIDNLNILDIKLNILNQLNVSYNIKYKNYTLLKLQDISLQTIINNKKILISLFEYLINCKIDKEQTILNILSEYLKIDLNTYPNINNRKNNIQIFINEYANYTADKLINLYMHNFDIENVFDILTNIDNKNNLILEILDRNNFTEIILIKLVNILSIYLSDILKTNETINPGIIQKYNDINLEHTLYNSITEKFINDWLTIIDINNISNENLLTEFLKISPIFHYNKSTIIIKLVEELFINKPTLFDYLIEILNTNIIGIYINGNFRTINNISMFLLLANNDDKLSNSLLEKLHQRITDLIYMNQFNKLIINIERAFHNQIFSIRNNKHYNKIKLYISNLEQNLQMNQNITNCKITLKNKENNILDKVYDKKLAYYHIIDNDILEITDNVSNILKFDIIPEHIKIYFNIGKTYYESAYKILKFNFNIENCILNIKLNDTNLICNLVQYVILYYILNNNYTIDQLINHIINNPSNDLSFKYLLSYINNLMMHNIINLTNKNLINILIIESNNTNLQLDISKFTPTSINKLIDTSTNLSTDILSTDLLSIEYYQYIIFTKMFKSNSTIIFKLSNIVNLIYLYTSEYITINKLNPNIKNLLLNIMSNISIEKIKQILKHLEKRNIIEEKNSDEFIYTC